MIVKTPLHTFDIFQHVFGKRIYITFKLTSMNQQNAQKTQREPYYYLNTLKFTNQKQTLLKFQVERLIFKTSY